MLTRREFIKLCLAGMASLSLSDMLIPQVAEALMERGGQRPPLIWLECTTCAGDYFSFLNTLRPDMRQILFETVRMHYSNTLMAAEGGLAITHLEQIAKAEHGNYILVVEGTIPTAFNGHVSLIGHRPDGTPITNLEALRFLADGAKYILAAGTCASFGGPYAANPNPTGSKPAHKVISQQVINVPGCPVHPDWMVGTLSHVLLYGVPALDSYNRPTLFYGKTIHDRCPRRTDFENSNFADKPGDERCLYKIGCKGPVTYSDCPTREWISAHTNWPIKANTPCIGCVAPGFPDHMSPFFKHLPDIHLPGVAANARTVGQVALGATALGIGGHLAATALSGRYRKHMLEGTETSEINPDLFVERHKSELEELEDLAMEIGVKHKELEEKIRYIKDGRKHYTIFQRIKNFFSRGKDRNNHWKGRDIRRRDDNRKDDKEE